jgi:Uri superfamily endonuclease
MRQTMPAAQQVQEPREAGTFGLVLEVGAERRLEVGSLGSVRFPEGQYAYAGQAKRGFDDRVARLVDGESRARRHVDRVVDETTRREAVRFPGDVDACDLATHLARAPGSLPVIGFGATGCTCLTHLHGFLETDRASVADAVAAWDGSA